MVGVVYAYGPRRRSATPVMIDMPALALCVYPRRLCTCVLEQALLEERALAMTQQAAPLAAVFHLAVRAHVHARAALSRHPAAFVVGPVQEGVPALPCNKCQVS